MDPYGIIRTRLLLVPVGTYRIVSVPGSGVSLRSRVFLPDLHRLASCIRARTLLLSVVELSRRRVVKMDGQDLGNHKDGQRTAGDMLGGSAPKYICGDCGAQNEIRPRDPIRCRFCGYRILYKARTKRRK